MVCSYNPLGSDYQIYQKLTDPAKKVILLLCVSFYYLTLVWFRIGDSAFRLILFIAPTAKVYVEIALPGLLYEQDVEGCRDVNGHTERGPTDPYSRTT